jgi:hypothetical protein
MTPRSNSSFQGDVNASSRHRQDHRSHWHRSRGHCSINRVTLAVPNHSVSAEENARGDHIAVPPALSHAGSLRTDEGPTIERPPGFTFDRFALVVLTLAVLALSFPLGGMVLDDDISAAALRMLALALALTSFVSGAVFGVWAFRQRTTIDDLRWRSFRRPMWGGWWSVVWTITPAVALIAFSVIEAQTDRLIGTSGVLLALVAVRILSLGALGTNMRRVVLDARRWVRAGAFATAFSDYLLVVIVWATLLEPQLDRDVLLLPASIIPLGALLAAVFSLSYAKRVERWVLEWWDSRWGCTQRDVLDRLGDVGAIAANPGMFSGRRLLPTAPLRLLVVASYLALAATTAWSGWTVWSLRNEVGDAEGLNASVARLDEVSLWFIEALLVMQACHAMWCIAQAWNARRCTLGTPGALSTAVLFLLAPAIVAVGVVAVDDAESLALVGALAVIVNLACWALSFSLLHRMARALGQSTRRIASWSSVIALHWALLFGVRSIVLVDDSAVFAGLVLAVAVVDAAIVFTAAVYAQLAMRDVERATRDFNQIRRRRVSRQRRRHRAPGGILVSSTPAAPPPQR